jgi:hypothetical protein
MKPSPSPPSPQSSAAQQDELERDKAACDDHALVAYHAKWQRRVARLQQRYPARWRVAGLSQEEVLAALTLRLIEVVRGERSALEQYRHERKEWGLVVMQQHLSVLRKSLRLRATPVDFSEAPAREHHPNQEELLLELETDASLRLAGERAQSQLSRPQRRWLAAFKLAANCGAFFAASDELNLSAASRMLQKHRSSAQRAYRELENQFRRELERSG